MAGISGDGSVGKVIVLRAARPDNSASTPGRDEDFSLFLVDFLRDQASLLLSRYWKFKKKNSPVTGLEWPRGFQEVEVPRFHDNGTGRW